MHGLAARERNLNRRPTFDGLVDNTIALGELEQLVEPVLRRIRLNVEAQADLRKADRCVLGDAERAAEIDLKLQARIGIHSGPVVAGSALRCRLMALRDILRCRTNLVGFGAKRT